MGDHSSVEVDAIVKNTVKAQKRRSGTYMYIVQYMPLGQKRKKNDYMPIFTFNDSPTVTIDWLYWSQVAETGVT